MSKFKAEEGSIFRQNKDRALTYSPDFKEWVKNHPGFLLKAEKLIEDFVAGKLPNTDGDIVSEGDIKIVHKKQPYSDIFEVTIGEDKFFVKRDSGKRLKDQLIKSFRVGGTNEYADSLTARLGLKDDPDIEVIDFQLGYNNNDEENPIKYFVSRWEDLKTCSEYIEEGNLSDEVKSELVRKIEKAQRLFREYQDIRPENMFYNPITKKIVMFDLNLFPSYSG